MIMALKDFPDYVHDSKNLRRAHIINNAVALHTCPNKIFSGLIQPISHAFPSDENSSALAFQIVIRNL